MMDLSNVLNGAKFNTKDDIAGLRINKVRADSKKIEKGDLFIAVRGYSVDGHRFIKEAVSRGAKAIVADRDFDAPPGVKKILVNNARIALPVIAGNFYKNPSSKIKVIGVTGTNGKTTITYLVENIFKTAGKGAGVIGTIDYRLKDRKLPAKNTTPGPLELEALLAEMVEMGLPYAIMEVSSHSLSQHRVDGISFDTAIFTNITSEHLDYHKTIRNYFDVKAKLFDKLKADGIAILNMDDKRVADLRRSIKKNIITYSLKRGADIMAEKIKPSLEGSVFSMITPKGTVEIKTRLIGVHNVSNILASSAAAFAEGFDLETIKRGIESLSYVPGRLEGIEAGQPFKVFLDYAHTEDALYNVLSLLRKLKKRGIITVFGCGGNRDRKKRPLMGKVACRFSDRVIITSDNPRYEEPSQIINEIEKGIRGKFANYDIIEDRRRAIEHALDSASKDDIVIIAGKGHEKYQIIKDRIVPFDDYEVARSVLNKKRYESKRDIKDNAGEFAVRQS